MASNAGKVTQSLQRAQQRPSGIERVAAISNANGERISYGGAVAEISAQFYEDLYKEDDVETTEPEDHVPGIVPPEPKEELTAALKRMEKMS